MITRRSLFASLAGLAAAPGVAKEVVIGMDFGTSPAIYPNSAFTEMVSIYARPFPEEFKMAVVDGHATLDRLIEKARSNLSRSQRDKGQQ